MTDPGPVLRDEGISLVGDSVEAFIPLLTANLERVKRRTGAGLHLSPMELLLAEALNRIELTYQMQYAVGPYDADFYFHDALLCVEVDGKYHEDRKERDQRRDEFFRSRGIETLRITGREIRKDAGACAARVARAIEAS